ncbi:MAG TPA: MFS transporter [Pyrinomonadaceae bacterium]|jgi:EmrB/QacA subfamily drug resistance transporter|nr:MFS transporter [Pyrinomonadaceae bacterium]
MQVAARANVTSQASPENLLVVFGGLLLVMLLAALDSTIVATALPTIVGEFGGLAHISWVVTAYLLAQTIVTPIYGKLGDLYGRKRVLQVAIVIFLIGSALCGLSQSMSHLIIFRAVQGLGGGGLMVTTQAVVADVVPPRARGRYQGIFGAAFGFASIAGPLVGGYFTTHWTWRWIFYINLPVGIIALVVLAATLPAQSSYARHAIDYAGAALLALALASVVLVTDLGGAVYSWSSPLMIGLIIVAVAALIGFVVVERRAREPILPLQLFRTRDVWVTSVVGLIVGFALIGSVTYLPVFLQIVKGLSPTESGLRMVPLMGGTLVTSIIAGQLVSRTGKYKLFPIIGTTIVTIALLLISRMTAETSTLAASLYMLLLGLGLGFVMQVLIIAVQNAVDYRDLGVATSNAILFRFIGGSLGTALLGSVLATQLHANAQRLLPGTAALDLISPQALAGLTPSVRGAYIEAFVASLSTVFLLAAAISFVGLLVALLLPERPLRETIAAAAESDIGGDIAQTFSMPNDTDSREQLLRGLAVLADRDVRRRYIASIVTRAGVDLSPTAAWLLVQIERERNVDVNELGRRGKCDAAKLKSATAELLQKSLIATDSVADVYRLTEAGCDTYNRLVTARREHLAELWPEWSPQKREEVAQILRRLARELIPEAG